VRPNKVTIGSTANLVADTANQTLDLNITNSEGDTKIIVTGDTPSGGRLDLNGVGTARFIFPENWTYSTTYTWTVLIEDRAGNQSLPETLTYTTPAPPLITSVCVGTVQSGKLSWPFKENHAISQYFGGAHDGIDFKTPTGTEIIASHDGVISFQGTDQYGGLYIDITNGNLKTRYLHLSKFALKNWNNVAVAKGQLIGYSGNTGKSTGPHLHYAVFVNNIATNPFGSLQDCSTPTAGSNLYSDADQEFLEQVKIRVESFIQNPNGATYANNENLQEIESKPIQNLANNPELQNAIQQILASGSVNVEAQVAGSLVIVTGGTLMSTGYAAASLAAPILACFASVVCGAAVVVGVVVVAGVSYAAYKYYNQSIAGSDAIPIAVPIDIEKPKEQDKDKDKMFVTYRISKYDAILPIGAKVYYGRTSGFCIPSDANDTACANRLMGQRFKSHWPLQNAGYTKIKLDTFKKGTLGRFAMRGREQMLIDSCGGVANVNNVIPTNCLNKIRGVAYKNAACIPYYAAAVGSHGPLTYHYSKTLVLPNCPPKIEPSMETTLDTILDRNNTELLPD
jgi:murein DD-endopeptidase MepM/ murein hydrolase activator NlpD